MNTHHFSPTETQIKCAHELLLALSRESLVTPIVEGYQNAILRKHQWHIAKRWTVGRRPMQDRIIDNCRDDYLLEPEAAEIYYRECEIARQASGLTVSNLGNCPRCEAETARMRAETALLRAMAQTPKLEHLAHARFLSLEKYQSAVDLSLHLVAPFIPKEMQQRPSVSSESV